MMTTITTTTTVASRPRLLSASLEPEMSRCEYLRPKRLKFKFNSNGKSVMTSTTGTMVRPTPAKQGILCYVLQRSPDGNAIMRTLAGDQVGSSSGSRRRPCVTTQRGGSGSRHAIPPPNVSLRDSCCCQPTDASETNCKTLHIVKANLKLLTTHSSEHFDSKRTCHLPLDVMMTCSRWSVRK
jgi:hypothetical protein